jgi:hypothetical protein
MTILAAIADIQAKGLAVVVGTPIKFAPAYPPEQVNQFPALITYYHDGQVQFMSAGWANYLHTIHAELHVCRANLPTDLALAYQFLEALPSKILSDPTLSGSVQEVSAIRCSTKYFGTAPNLTIGVLFEIDVKTNLT